jgi:adenylosuccinate lyase
MVNPNILSQRYVSPSLNYVFSEHHRNLLERELWIEVMKTQRDLGVDMPSEDIEKFERAKGDIDLERIRRIEAKRRHDIKAKIEDFVEAANAGEHIHKAMTSRDLSDNVDLIQQLQASKIILGKSVSLLRHFLDKACDYKDIVLTARTHHQPAQPTLLGRRWQRSY